MLSDHGSNSVAGVIVFNILTSGAMSQIWGMINSMQLFGNLPIFEQVEFPTFSKATSDGIIEISSFEVIPLGDLLSEALDIPDDDGEEIHDTDAAALIGYESYYMISNLGSLFVIFLWLCLGIPLIFVLLRPFRTKSRYIGNKVSSLSDSLRGNLMIRFIIEGALDICICIAFQFEFKERNNGLNFDTAFMGINTVMTILFTTVLALFIPFLFIFYLKRFETWGDETFDNRYGAVFDGLRKDKKSSLGYPLIHFLRRFIFIMVAILAIDKVFI